MTGRGHPLPGSDEARHGEIPEHLEREKGRGDDSAPAIQPGGEAVNPDGEAYPADAPGPDGTADALERDQAAHQDRGQSVAQSEADDG